MRLVVPLAIIRWPLAGSWLAIMADSVDVVVWQLSGVVNLSTYYNQWDKLLDTYFYLIQGWVVWKRWKNRLAKKAALSLLGWRFLGVAIYELWPQRWLLLVFPNLFLTFYMVYLSWIWLTGKDPVQTKKKLVVFLVVLLVPKLYQEYLFHVAEFPLYQTIKSLLGFK